MARKLTPESLLELTFIASAQLSPDGQRAAAVQTTIAEPKEEDKFPYYRSRIYLYDIQSGEGKAFTQSPKADTMPRFSPDGSQLAFLSQRHEEDKSQLYVMPLSGGEARQLTKLKSGVREFAWHPDGEHLAYISQGDWEDKAAEKGEAKAITRMSYKANGLGAPGIKSDEVAQIYLLDLEKDQSEKLSDLKSDPDSLVFSPDGRWLYFSGAADWEEEDLWHSNLWRLPSEGGEAEALVKNVHVASTPSPSPDGRRLAFFAPSEDENFASPTGVWLVPSEGGEARLLTGELEATPSAGGDSHYGSYPNKPLWSDDSRYLYVNVNQGGGSGITRIEPDSGELEPLQQEDRVVSGFHHQKGNFAFTAETPDHPGELFVRDAQGRETQLSHANAGFVKKYRLTKSSPAQHAKAKGGPDLSYWTLEPHKSRQDRALVLEVHGGPHTNYGYGFYFEFQLLAAGGYTVVYGNPRGSSSYGQDFEVSMLGGYGTVDADDILAIARAARETHPDAPMHLTGGSYGGFMTNWLVGQTDEFKSAVTQRSICNWLSMYGTSDIGYRFNEREVGGNPWDDTDKLWRQSPLKYVANVTTPLLILHAEEDFRCPMEQAEQFYIALKRIGKADTKLIRFPGESHELSRSGRPDRRLARLEAILEWFGTHA
jgi:dipeptidyl aminopeptidase/acylaminoacyl peptidase